MSQRPGGFEKRGIGGPRQKGQSHTDWEKAKARSASAGETSHPLETVQDSVAIPQEAPIPDISRRAATFVSKPDTSSSPLVMRPDQRSNTDPEALRNDRALGQGGIQPEPFSHDAALDTTFTSGVYPPVIRPDRGNTSSADFYRVQESGGVKGSFGEGPWFAKELTEMGNEDREWSPYQLLWEESTLHQQTDMSQSTSTTDKGPLAQDGQKKAKSSSGVLGGRLLRKVLGNRPKGSDETPSGSRSGSRDEKSISSGIASQQTASNKELLARQLRAGGSSVDLGVPLIIANTEGTIPVKTRELDVKRGMSEPSSSNFGLNVDVSSSQSPDVLPERRRTDDLRQHRERSVRREVPQDILEKGREIDNLLSQNSFSLHDVSRLVEVYNTIDAGPGDVYHDVKSRIGEQIVSKILGRIQHLYEKRSGTREYIGWSREVRSLGNLPNKLFFPTIARFEGNLTAFNSKSPLVNQTAGEFSVLHKASDLLQKSGLLSKQLDSPFSALLVGIVHDKDIFRSRSEIFRDVDDVIETRRVDWTIRAEQANAHIDDTKVFLSQPNHVFDYIEHGELVKSYAAHHNLIAQYIDSFQYVPENLRDLVQRDNTRLQSLNQDSPDYAQTQRNLQDSLQKLNGTWHDVNAVGKRLVHYRGILVDKANSDFSNYVGELQNVHESMTNSISENERFIGDLTNMIGREDQLSAQARPMLTTFDEHYRGSIYAEYKQVSGRLEVLDTYKQNNLLLEKNLPVYDNQRLHLANMKERLEKLVTSSEVLEEYMKQLETQ